MDTEAATIINVSAARRLLALLALSAGACSGAVGSHLPSNVTPGAISSSSRPSPLKPIPWVALENDYPHSENFCARPPLAGSIRYLARSHRVTLRFHVHGLPPNSDVGVFWINNSTRGYLIAFARSTPAGTIQLGSLRMFRGGEVHGQGMQLQTEKERLLGNLKPCS